jgi:hypothetical protein
VEVDLVSHDTPGCFSTTLADATTQTFPMTLG